jgi:Family of unknown function (DUF6056)
LQSHPASTSGRLFGLAVVLLALTPLVAHAYLGTFSRYLADDFCTASSLRRLGFLASQSYWYETWSGRYSFTFVVSLTQAMGPRLTPLLASAALLVWMAAGSYQARRLFPDLSQAGWLAGLTLAAIHAFTTLEGSPSVYQSLYWQTGMITYLLPLTFSLAYLGWLWPAASGRLTPRRLPAASAVSFIVGFLLGGFSETFVAVQTTALGLGLLVALVLARRDRRLGAAALLGAGLAGSILAGLALALAPGTQVRSALMPPHPELGVLIEATLKDGYLFLARTGKALPLGIAMAVLVPLILAMIQESGVDDSKPSVRGTLLGLIIIPVATPVLILSTIAPYEYAISSYPDARVLVSTMFVLSLGLVVWGTLLGRLLVQVGSRWLVRVPQAVLLLAAVTLLALAATVVPATSRILSLTAEARDYARSWDTRDANLREATGAELVAAASLRHMGGLAEVGRDPDEWINRCIAGTYGLGAVVAK